MITVLPRDCTSSRMVARISSSDSTSTLLVASSNTNTGESCRSARAMAMRWRWPPDRLAASGSIVMSRPSCCERTKSAIRACSSVSQRRESTASDAASPFWPSSGKAIRRFSRRVPANRWLLAPIRLMVRASVSPDRSDTLTPFSVSEPWYPVNVPASSAAAVDLPEPEMPTMAVS